MSYFTVGGTIGFSLGPIMVTPRPLKFGLPGTLFMIIPAVIVAVGLTRELPLLSSFRPPLSVQRCFPQMMIRLSGGLLPV